MKETGNDQKGMPGNASNPLPNNEQVPAGNQLIDEKGEKYIREVASIEDLPDAADEQERQNMERNGQ